MHGFVSGGPPICSTANSTEAGYLMQQGDAEVNKLITGIKNSKAWKNRPNAIILVWDENDYSNAANRVVMLVENNYGKNGLKSSTYGGPLLPATHARGRLRPAVPQPRLRCHLADNERHVRRALTGLNQTTRPMARDIPGPFSLTALPERRASSRLEYDGRGLPRPFFCPCSFCPSFLSAPSARFQNPRGPNTLMPSFFSSARPKRYFISGPS